MMLHPEFLWLLVLLIPVAAVILRNYRLGRKEFGRVKGSGPSRHLFDVFTIKWFFSSFFFLLSLLFIILSLAGFKNEKETLEELPADKDVIFAVDISRSMLSRDIQPSRLERSVTLMNSIMGRVESARYGLVLFKGAGYVYVPVTEDLEGLNKALDTISPSLFTSRSTSIEAGLRTAFDAFPRGEERRRIVVLITDGEAHSGNSAALLEAAADREITVDVIGVGTEEGGRIPLDEESFLRNESGDFVVSRLNPVPLRKIAEGSEGAYCQMDVIGSLSELFECLSLKEEGEHIRLIEQEKYKPFLLIAIAALLISFLVRVIPWRGTY
ncbi:MAG: VWA domain-containing protein [bacterium]